MIIEQRIEQADPEWAWPESLPPEHLPTHLAIPLGEYLREPNPRVRLHWMLDTLEVAIRWAVAVVLAEVRAAHDDGLPPQLQKSIQAHIERPTVGRWVGMLRALSGASPANPILTADIFGLHDAHVAPLFSSEGTESDSLLVLRNRVAHGGGLSSRKSQELLQAHDPRFLGLMKAIVDCTRDLSVQAHDQDGVVELFGIAPRPAAAPGPLSTPSDEAVWLTDGQRALSLSPLVAYGPIRVLGKEGDFQIRSDVRVPQLYARASAQSLSFTPLGRDEAHSERPEIEAFRKLFGLDDVRSAKKGGRRGFAPDDFLKEAGGMADSLVGRVEETRAIKKWIKKCDCWDPKVARVAWLRAGPGIGKSMLIARIARDLGNSGHNGLYYHHFQTGDVRNNRRMFLQLLQEALWQWKPLQTRTAPPSTSGDLDDLQEDVRQRLDVVAKIPSKNPRARPPSFRIILDGVDAVMAQDPTFPEMLRQLALPGTIWVVAGRPDHGLGAALTGDDIVPLFGEGGLPPMSVSDIRALLLDGLGNARYALLKRDEDDENEETVHNAFVERVVERAGGLPLYVELLLDDLRSGFLTVDDEEQLPDGLNTYYGDLIGRMGISDVQVNLTLLVCVLARSEEPLDQLSIRYLLSPSLDIGEDTIEPEEGGHVSAVLRAGRTLLRQTVAPSGERAFVLYHNGFREYINHTDALRRTRRRAEALLIQTADRWHELPDSNLRDHLFRWGTEYALWWGSARGLRAVRGRLTDFDYLMARTAALPAFENLDLAREFSMVRARMPEDTVFADWEAFIQAHDHLLRRGTETWPSDRILLQLAAEYADNSPVTQAADAWLDRHDAPWLWLRLSRRPVHVSLSAGLTVLEGHSRKIDGALRVGETQVLSWSMDTTLRLWDFEAGTALQTFEGHAKRVWGAQLLPDRRMISWSDDGTLRIWSLDDGQCLHVLAEHDKCVMGLTMLDDGTAVSNASEKGRTVRRWDLNTGACLGVFKGHKRWIKGTVALPGGRFLTYDRTMRIFDPAVGEKPQTVLKGHKSDIYGVLLLDETGQRALSWSKDKTLRLWSLSDGEAVAVLDDHGGDVLGALLLGDEQALSWSKDGTLRIWSTADGTLLATLSGHSGPVVGARILDEHRLLSWSDDGTLRTWDRLTWTPLAGFVGNDGAVVDVVSLEDGRILSCSSRGPIEVWDGETGAHISRLNGHSTTVEGAAPLSGQRLLSWSSDRTIRVWSTEPALLTRIAQIDAENANPDEHDGFVAGARLLPDGRALSWAKDKTLRIWDGAKVTILEGHEDAVEGARPFGADGLLSWSRDLSLRVWDLKTGAARHVLRGHTRGIKGVRFLGDQRLLSWSSDATLRLWDLSAGDEIATLKGHKKLIKGVELLPGDRILSYASDGELRLWSALDGAEISVWKGHKKIVEGASRLSDGRILSWSSDATLRLWSDQGEALGVLEGHDPKKSVKGAVVLSDGRILSWSSDATLRLWSDQGEALGVLEGHTEEIAFATELSDGRLISFGRDNAFRRWTAEGGALDAISADDAPLAWTEDWMAWKTARRPAWACGVAVFDETPGGVRVLIADEDGPVVIQWHAERGRWFADTIDGSGELIARDTIGLYFLHLCYGRERVDFQRAQEIIV